MAAQEKGTSAAFLASEKAIIKAEDAQKEYNIRSNEFRGQLDDQAKTLMPRIETDTRFRSVDDKIMGIEKSLSDRLVTFQISADKTHDGTTKDIADIRLGMTNFLTLSTYETRHTELQRQVNDLRESRSEGMGKTLGINSLWGFIAGGIGIGIAIVTFIIKISGN